MKIINVMASSLDGLIATSHDEQDKARRDMGFVNEDDKAHVKAQLEQADAVICGANSMTASGRIWEVINHKGVYPEWYIYTNRGLDSQLEFWKQEKITRFLVSQSELSKKKLPHQVGNIVYAEHSPSRYLYNWLSQKNSIKNVVLFGGGYINQMFYQENLVDELKITICPFLLGANKAAKLLEPPLPQPSQLELVSSKVIHNHVFLDYRILKN